MPINDSKIWNDFTIGQKPVQFLQSWQWGEFQQRLGRQIFRLRGDWGQALIIKYILPLGKSYLYCPRGPTLKLWNTETFNLFFKEVEKIAEQEKSIFFRFEPPIISKFEIRNSKFERVADIQPSKTVLLDLSLPEERLLGRMHYKTRYNIRLAQRRGLRIREGDPAEIEVFLKLLCQTTRRDKFQSHPDNYYQQLINLELSKLFIAEYQARILVANIIIFFGDTATYVHGASSDEYKNLMAPHLLQWEVIRQAKQLGYHFYDFWGIDEKKWPGVTRFKKGFSGQEIKYAGTFDLIFDKFWYQLYRLGKKFI